MLLGALLMDDGMTHHCVASVSEVQEFDIVVKEKAKTF